MHIYTLKNLTDRRHNTDILESTHWFREQILSEADLQPIPLSSIFYLCDLTPHFASLRLNFLICLKGTIMVSSS